MYNKWSFPSEILRREHGFSDRYNFRLQNTISFEKELNGSKYILKNIKPTNAIDITRPYCCDFNEKGNLLCIATHNRTLNIYDWAKTREICNRSIAEMSGAVYVKFINSDSNRLDIVGKGIHGDIWHATLSPSGRSEFTCLYTKNNDRPVHAPTPNIIPRKFPEYIIVDANYGLYLMDVRCQEPQTLLKDWKPMRFSFGAQHPNGHEICVGNDDISCDLYIYDIRSLQPEEYKILPADSNGFHRAINCSYNFDGSRILVEYSRGLNHVFENYESKFFMEKCQAGFLGPRSEYIAALSRKSLCFYSENFEKLYEHKCSSLITPRVFSRILQCHPFLPMLATHTGVPEELLIWSTRNQSVRTIELMSTPDKWEME